MAESDPDRPAILTTLPTETVAALLVARLRSEGLVAEMSGALTSAFRAEVPGGVRVLVLERDLDKARQVMAECHSDDS